MTSSKDMDLVVICSPDIPLTELSSVKGTCDLWLILFQIYVFIRICPAARSQLDLHAPKLDGQLPVSAHGGLLDIHVTAFVSAIGIP
jgi:hypothetical protein